MNSNDEFDPKKYTAKELLKVLLLKMEDMEARQETMSNKVNELKSDLDKRNILAEDKEKRKNFAIAVAGLLGGLFMWIVQVIYEAFLSR